MVRCEPTVYQHPNDDAAPCTGTRNAANSTYGYAGSTGHDAAGNSCTDDGASDDGTADDAPDDGAADDDTADDGPPDNGTAHHDTVTTDDDARAGNDADTGRDDACAPAWYPTQYPAGKTHIPGSAT